MKVELSKEQRDAVEAKEPKVLVRAGAGSGKTRVLTERIAHLIEKRHASPHEIMAFTFTRKAAGEMKGRLADRIGGDAFKLTIGTSHAVALDYIQRHAEMVGFQAPISVYGEFETNWLIEHAGEKLGHRKGKKWKTPKKLVLEVFKDYNERGVEPDTLHPLRPLFDSFITSCRVNNAMHYGAILVYFRALISQLKPYYPIQHVLVDEVQDNDELQWEILDILRTEFDAELFCVGDPDQSIYEFRGAVPHYLVEHQKEFAIYDLSANYRSFSPIVSSADRLISKNEHRLDTTMAWTRYDGNKDHTSVIRGLDSSAFLSYLRDSDLEPSRTAILARNHFLLQKLANLMDEAEVPYYYIGRKTEVTKTEEFRRYHAFLKLVVNPHDDLSFMLISEVLDVQVEQITKMQVHGSRDGLSLFQVWMREPTGNSSWVRMFEATGRGELSFREITTLVHAKSFLEDEEAWAFVQEWIDNNPNGSLAEYLQWLSTYDVQDELTDDRQTCYQLATVHAAKGLEWPNVVIVGANEGLVPSSQAIRCGDIEGERRLMYVAMTRAEERLLLAVRPEETMDSRGKVNVNPESRFVGEAGL